MGADVLVQQARHVLRGLGGHEVARALDDHEAAAGRPGQLRRGVGRRGGVLRADHGEHGARGAAVAGGGYRITDEKAKAEAPRISTAQAKEIAKLIGVAPLPNDSGKHRGRRTIWGGRIDVRKRLSLGLDWGAGKPRGLWDSGYAVCQVW